jgi:ectoine hydroxylase-related dioxygenase (phytanoyl-CoA dioxygenase family)
MSQTTQKSFVTPEQVKQFHEEGYFILEKVIADEVLEAVREECNRFIEEKDREMDEKGVDHLGITHKGKRYFIAYTRQKSRIMHDFIFGPIYADICRSVIGSDATLFLDQFVVKAGEKGLPFSWHQDSGYLPFDHAPYVTCWAALDDVTEENGTVYLLPYSRLGIKTRVTHIKDPELNDMVGYFGDDPGIPVIVPAGSIAVFSSVCFHRSGANLTSNMRRVMLSQYAAGPIVDPATNKLFLDGVPFLKDGEVITELFKEAK